MTSRIYVRSRAKPCRVLVTIIPQNAERGKEEFFVHFTEPREVTTGITS